MSTVPSILGQTATPYLLGFFLDWFLYGVLILQTYLYYIAFPNDKHGIQALVYSLFLAETLQTALMTHHGVEMLGLGYGNPAELRHVHLAWFSVPILSTVASAMVQIFFAWRIYVLSRSPFMSLTIVLIALVQLGAGIAQGYFSYIINDLSHLPRIPSGIWLSSAAACDIIIAIFMAYSLQKKATGFRKTNVLITRLTRLSIETGSLSAFMATLTVVLFFGVKNHNYFVTPSYILGKLYANNLMMIFNSRINIVGSRNGPPTVDETQSTLSRDRIIVSTLGSSSVSGWSGSTVPVQVNIQRTVEGSGMPLSNMNTAKIDGYQGETPNSPFAIEAA